MPHGKDQVKPGLLRRNSSISITDARIAGLYDLEHTIGKGHFAVVKLARHVAVKVIDKTKLDPESAADLMQEVRCMKLVQHPNIVRLYEVIDTHTKLFLILELGDYDMYDYIMKTSEKGIKESDAQQYFSQITKAIDYCHALHVVHRDLKPENVVFFEKLGMVKLTDFGFSNLYTPGQMLQTSCGSLAYSAPEILLGDAYDAPAIDVWSLGVILYMLVCGRLPFQEANESETLTRILDCRYSIPDHVSPQCKELIEKMLVRDPRGRASLTDILRSPWVIAGDHGHAEALPLIFKEHLSDETHATIVEQMVAGGIGSEESILTAIDQGDYSYITATYYLLAERVLAACREEQASRLRKESSTSEECDRNSGPITSNLATRSRSNSWRGLNTRRPCSILKEESEEELSTYLRSSSRQSSRYFNARRDGSQASKFHQSRGSSVESYRAPRSDVEDQSERRKSSRSMDRVEDRHSESDLEPTTPSKANNSTLSASQFTFDELSPIRETIELYGATQCDLESESESARSLLAVEVNSLSHFHANCAPRLARTPSAPIPVSAKSARRIKPLLSRRNSSPSVSMFARCTSRERISPQAVQELLEVARCPSLRRAPSPERLDSPMSRSSSPCSSGRTSPAVSVSSISSRLKVTSLGGGTGMRKLSSSPHLLGICEEIEDFDETGASDSSNQTPPADGKPSFTVGPTEHRPPIVGRGVRSASTGFAGHRFPFDLSAGRSSTDLSRKSISYASLRAIRNKQLNHSMDSSTSEYTQKLARTRRSTSCSSSETSDDDTNERRLNLIAMKYCRKDREDPQPDDDPAGPGPDTNPTAAYRNPHSSNPCASKDSDSHMIGSSSAPPDEIPTAKRANLHPILEHPIGADSCFDQGDVMEVPSVWPKHVSSIFCRQLRRSCSLEGRKTQHESVEELCCGAQGHT